MCKSSVVKIDGSILIVYVCCEDCGRLGDTKQKWVIKEITKYRRAKEKSWKKYIKSGKNQNEYKNYLEKLHEGNKINKQVKVEFEKKLATSIKKDSKSFFAYVRSKQRIKDKVGPLINEAGNLNTQYKYAADFFKCIRWQYSCA